MLCYPETMCSPVVRGGLLAGLLALAGSLAPRAAAGAQAETPQAATLQVASAADGALEVRQGTAVLLRLQPRTAALRRGTPRVRVADVDGHAILDVRLPVRGSASEEVWIHELPAPDTRDARAGKAPAPIWSGLTGPRDADEEIGTELEVTPDRIVEYQTASQISRCDGETPRLFPRAWDFASGRFRSMVSPVPPPAPQKLIARRGDPAMPSGRPIGGFHWVAASTTASAGTDARNLTPPLAVDDGDPATSWTEGLGGDGRGEFLTARSTSAGYAVRGVRIIPGDASSAIAFRGKNRLRRFQLLLGPKAEQHFDVEIPDDPAADAAHFAEPYWVVLPKPTPAACMTLVITDVARGSEAAPPRNFGTTAIADLAIFTDLDGPEGVGRLVDDIATGPDCQQRVPLLVRLGEPAIMATAQSILGAKGLGRECLVEGLVALAPAPGSSIVTDALTASLSGATDKEERLVTAALKTAPAPPIATLGQLLHGKTPKGDNVALADRQRAARVLGALPQSDAAAVLVGAAGQGPEALRMAVVKAIGDSSAADPTLLLGAMAKVEPKAEKEETARYADLVRALVPSAHRRTEHNGAVLAALRGALDPARDFEVRARAVMALGDLRLPEATGDLIALRKSSDEPVLRYLAARELASIGGPDGIRALREALSDGDPRVRETAAMGLGRLKDTWSGQALIDGAKQEAWPFVRRAELEALGHLCIAGTGDLMIRATERDVDQVRRAALVTLVRCKDTRARPVLLRTLGLRNEAATLRELAGALVGELGDKTAAHDLAVALKRLVNEGEGDLAVEGVAVAVLRSLAHLGGPEAVSSAVALANDTHHPYRQNAIEALGLLCDPGAGAKTLHAIGAGGDSTLALTAQSALHHCGGR
jgi:HEAT repeat protein